MIKIEACENAELLSDLNEELQNLHHELYPDQFKKHRKVDIVPALAKMLSQKHCHGYVAYVNEEPAGYIVVMINQRPENAFQNEMLILHLDQIFVKEEMRPHGVASAFMEKLKSIAVEIGANRIQLDHWSANDRARRFFRKSGFTCYNERMEYVL